MTGAIAIVLVLAVLIAFHELGHFLAARLTGIGVRTFSLGFGKALLTWKGHKTKYQLSLVPLGGYVDLVGMQPSDEIAPPFSPEDSYAARSPARRLLTVAAGPVFNIVLAWFIYWCLMWSGSAILLPEVGDLQPGSPAQAAGFLPGDIISSIDGKSITAWEDLLFAVQSSQGQTLDITVQRQGLERRFRVAPENVTHADAAGKAYSVYRIGVSASRRYLEVSFFRAGALGFKEAWNKTLLVARMVSRLFAGEGSLADNIGGPVMVAQTVHQQATHGGFAGVLKLTALLSINLGLLNLLPIPALDGGHILFNLIELIFRRPVPERIQSTCTYAGFIFLIGIMILATVMDVLRLAG